MTLKIPAQPQPPPGSPVCALHSTNGGSIDVVAACALLSIEDATENDRRRAGQPASDTTKPAQPGTLAARPPVTAAARARVRAVAAEATAADAKAALLEEIGRKHGQAAAKAAQDLSIDKLIGRAAAPTRAAIAESWARTFKAKGIEIKDDATVSPNATRREQIAASWDNALKRMGAQID